MRYRPLGQTGMPVSVIALTLDDRAGQHGAGALAGLIFAAMEAGVNAFHIESCEPEVLQALGRALTAVERRLLFVSARLGPRPDRTGLIRDFSPGALTGAIDQVLTHTGLGHLDLVLLDEPGENELPTTALTALTRQRTTGRVSLLGVAGAHDAMDVYLGARAFDVLASPHHLRSGWKQLNRLKTAAHMNMGVIAYDYFPELFRQASTTPGFGLPQKRSLLGAITGAPVPHPLAGAGTYAFLHETISWTAEELCLAYALMEPSVSTVLIRAHEIQRLEALTAVPDRDLPPGMAAKVEMARFGMEEAADASSNGGVVDAIKGLISYFESFNISDTYATLRSRIADVSDGPSGVGAPRAEGRPKGFLANWPLHLPLPDASLWANTVTPPNALSSARSRETSGLPKFDATPRQQAPAAQPGAAQPQTAIWRSKDYDYPVLPTGESFPGPDGRTYLKVDFNGSLTFVPADEIIFTQDMTPAQPAPVDNEAPPARAARGRR